MHLGSILPISTSLRTILYARNSTEVCGSGILPKYLNPQVTVPHTTYLVAILMCPTDLYVSLPNFMNLNIILDLLC